MLGWGGEGSKDLDPTELTKLQLWRRLVGGGRNGRALSGPPLLSFAARAARPLV